MCQSGQTGGEPLSFLLLESKLPSHFRIQFKGPNYIHPGRDRLSFKNLILSISGQDGPGVTSLIASTVFSFVDRDSCLEETDPVNVQVVWQFDFKKKTFWVLDIVYPLIHKRKQSVFRFWLSTRSIDRSWTSTGSRRDPLMYPLMTIRCHCDSDDTVSSYWQLCINALVGLSRKHPHVSSNTNSLHSLTFFSLLSVFRWISILLN